ncbi:MAG: iron-containing alcohol dehydrogenase [Deferribacteraceae bacterium]|jgi:alcohol dehydrogenase class IV|nr:iron-containing alcohol dehydrogenase [Deferribacteraceae bacterium]
MTTFYNPTSIVFGEDALLKLPEILSNFGKGVLFLSGRQSLEQNSAFNAVYSQIKPYVTKHIAGIASKTELADTLELIRKCDGKYDAILAIGGSSVIGSAKALSSLYSNRSLSVDGLRKAILAKKFAAKKLPVITVPTTASTGAEVNQWATLWDRELLTHYIIGDASTFPQYAVIDPRLQETMTPQMTISGGLDILSNAAESFWAKQGSAMSKAYSAKAIALVLTHLEQTVKTGHMRHRSNMAIASTMAGVASSVAGTTLCRALSYPLALEYTISQGVASALTLAEAYQYNKGGFAEEQSFEELLVKGLHHQSLSNYIKQVCTLGDVPTRLADYGVTREVLQEIAEKAANATTNLAGFAGIENNPKEADVNTLLDLLKKAY